MATRKARCVVLSSAQVAPEEGFCYAHELRLPCGRTRVSRAETPPLTVAACSSCDFVQTPTKRPELEWE